VNLANVSQQFTQGDVNNTGNVLDMAIQGGGFFVQSAQRFAEYTRAGAFRADKDGYITNNTGTSRLQGLWIPTARSSRVCLTDLQSTIEPGAESDQHRLDHNLNSSEVVIDQVAKPFNPSDTSTFTTQYSTTLYDTQGNAHPMVQYLVKTGRTNGTPTP
jgi:flagellar hook protein FlgE